MQGRSTRVVAVLGVLVAAAVALAAMILIRTSGQAGIETPPPPVPERLDGVDPAIVRRFQEAADQVRQSPRDARHWTHLGMIYHAHEQLELARECYEVSLSLRERDAKTLYYLSLVQQVLGESHSALDTMQQVIAEAPDYGPAHWRLGLWLLEQAEFAQAERAIQQAITLDGDDDSARLALARLRLQEGRYQEAAGFLETLIRGDPGNRYAHLLLGTAYRSLGREEDAQRHQDLGVGAKPVWNDPWRNELRRYATGFRADFDAALRVLHGPEPHKAVGLLEALRRRQPGNIDVLIDLSVAYRRTGRVDEAISVLHDALQRSPQHYMVHFHLAGAHRQKAVHVSADAAEPLLVEALRHAQTVVDLNPTFAAGHAIKADILEQWGRLEEAAASYQAAAHLDPRNPLWPYRGGAALCELKRWDEAMAMLAPLRQLAGDDADAMYLLGAAQANGGKLAEAESNLRRALELRPGDAKIKNALDLLLQGLEDLRVSEQGPSP